MTYQFKEFTTEKVVEYLDKNTIERIEPDHERCIETIAEIVIGEDLVQVTYLPFETGHVEIFFIHIGSIGLIDGEENYIEFDISDFNHEQQNKLETFLFD